MDMRLATVPAPSAARLAARFSMELSPERMAQIDFNNKSSLTAVVIAVPTVAMALIIGVVSLRLVVRRHSAGSFLVDDYLIILAAVFTLVVCSVVIAATKFGLGLHIWNLDLQHIIDELKNCIQLMFVANIFYALAIAFTKLSIIASYIHIFSPRGTFRIILYVTAVVTTGLGIASVPATVFQCRPVAGAWDFTLTGARCYHFVDFLYASTAINVSTDLVLCIAPIPIFWRLQLPTRQKVLISSLFFLGGLACVAAMIRLSYLHLLADPFDVTYDLVSSVMWTIAETTIGIVCVSLPPLRRLLVHVFPSIFHLHGSAGSQTAKGQKHQPFTADVVELPSVATRVSRYEEQHDDPETALKLGQRTGVSVTISAGGQSDYNDFRVPPEKSSRHNDKSLPSLPGSEVDLMPARDGRW